MTGPQLAHGEVTVAGALESLKEPSPPDALQHVVVQLVANPCRYLDLVGANNIDRPPHQRLLQVKFARHAAGLAHAVAHGISKRAE